MDTRYYLYGWSERSPGAPRRWRSCLVIQAILFILAPAVVAAGPATRPYLAHFPGVGGFMQVDQEMLAGLQQGGLNAEIHVDDWTGSAKGVPALHNYDHNRAEAKRAALAISTRIAQSPDKQFDFTSHSGGGAMAVWTLEDLPAEARIDNVLLLAPALSPDYDLTSALRHVKGKMYVFWSEGDQLILGVGCRLCGTMDGKMTAAAGRVSFTRPASGDPGQYTKLDQRPYNPQWLSLGNIGDHVGPMSRRFAAKVLAPLLQP